MRCVQTFQIFLIFTVMSRRKLNIRIMPLNSTLKTTYLVRFSHPAELNGVGSALILECTPHNLEDYYEHFLPKVHLGLEDDILLLVLLTGEGLEIIQSSFCSQVQMRNRPSPTTNHQSRNMAVLPLLRIVKASKK